MSALLQQFFTAQALNLAEGRISTVARAYAVPLPVFLGADCDWRLLRSRDDIEAAFTAKREGVRAAGIDRLRAAVTQEKFPHSERCVAHVDWYYLGAEGQRLGRTTARYFLGRNGNGFVVEMIEFQSIAFPQLRDWFSSHSTNMPQKKKMRALH